MSVVIVPAVVFSSPWMLWGLLLAVVPLVIQLFFRPRYRDEPWGAMQFLDEALRRQRHRMQLEQWLQLLVRTLLIMALVLALAQPIMEERASSTPSDGSVHWILVWDSSLSMRAMTGTESAFERGRTRLLELVDRAPQGSSFRLVRPASHHERLLVSQPLFDLDAMRLELELLQPTLDGNDWPAALRDLLTLLPSSPASRTEVVIVSDFQKREWLPPRRQREQLSRLFRDIDRQAGLTLLDVGANVENCSVTKIEVSPDQRFPGSSGDVALTVVNHGQQSTSLDVDLLVDEAPHGRETAVLGSGEERTIRFPIALFEAGEHIVSARLPDDALPEDNQQRAVLPIAKELRLLIVQTPSAQARRQPADYLRLVFPAPTQLLNVPPAGEGSNYRLDIATPSELSSLPLDDYAGILLCNVPELPPETIVRLERFVRLGGGLIIAPGDRSVQTDAGLGLLESSLIGAVQVELIGPVDADSPPQLFRAREPDHPLIAAFRDRPEAGLTTTRIYKYVKLNFAQPEAWNTVVTYTSGDAALLTRDSGRGRIALLTTALDDSWSSWPLWPSFVPMLRELERYVTAGRFQRDQLTVGDTWVRRAAERVQETTVPAALNSAHPSKGPPSITDPEQRTRLADLSPTEEQWLYTQTNQPGVYTVTANTLIEPFAVNIDPREGAMQRAGIDEVKEDLLNGLPVRTQLSGETTGLGGLSSGHEFRLVFILLLIATVLWLAELLLQQHAGAGLVLLVSLLEASLLAGPEANLLQLSSTIIILTGVQGLLLALYLRRHSAGATT